MFFGDQAQALEHIATDAHTCVLVFLESELNSAAEKKLTGSMSGDVFESTAS